MASYFGNLVQAIWLKICKSVDPVVPETAALTHRYCAPAPILAILQHGSETRSARAGIILINAAGL